MSKSKKSSTPVVPSTVLDEGVYYRAEPSTSCEEAKVAIQALFKFN